MAMPSSELGALASRIASIQLQPVATDADALATGGGAAVRASSLLRGGCAVVVLRRPG